MTSEYRRIISQSIRQMVDQEQALLDEMQPKIIERIRYGSGYRDLDAETYTQMHRERGIEIAQNIVDVVRDSIVEYATAETDGFGDALLRDLMDLGDAGIWEDIADAYVPEPADYEAAL
jgi:hypothetical protein